MDMAQFGVEFRDGLRLVLRDRRTGMVEMVGTAKPMRVFWLCQFFGISGRLGSVTNADHAASRSSRQLRMIRPRGAPGCTDAPSSLVLKPKLTSIAGAIR